MQEGRSRQDTDTITRAQDTDLLLHKSTALHCRHYHERGFEGHTSLCYQLEVQIWDGHIMTASRKSCVHSLVVREVGEKIPSNCSICSKRQFLFTKDTQMLRFWILGRGSNPGNSRRMSKFTAVRMRECYLLFFPSIFSAPVGFLDSLFLQILIQNLF